MIVHWLDRSLIEFLAVPSTRTVYRVELWRQLQRMVPPAPNRMAGKLLSLQESPGRLVKELAREFALKKLRSLSSSRGWKFVNSSDKIETRCSPKSFSLCWRFFLLLIKLL